MHEMTVFPDIEVLLEKLNAFESPEAIAGFFAEQGITGDIQDGDSCVITNWVLTLTDARGCTTTERMISVMTDDFSSIDVEPSEVVAEFISQFDDRAYPNLITKCGCDDCWDCYQ